MPYFKTVDGSGFVKDSDVSAFLQDYPDAIEGRKFKTSDGEGFIGLADIDAFKADYPDAIDITDSPAPVSPKAPVVAPSSAQASAKPAAPLKPIAMDSAESEIQGLITGRLPEELSGAVHARAKEYYSGKGLPTDTIDQINDKLAQSGNPLVEGGTPEKMLLGNAISTLNSKRAKTGDYTDALAQLKEYEATIASLPINVSDKKKAIADILSIRNSLYAAKGESLRPETKGAIMSAWNGLIRTLGPDSASMMYGTLAQAQRLVGNQAGADTSVGYAEGATALGDTPGERYGIFGDISRSKAAGADAGWSLDKAADIFGSGSGSLLQTMGPGAGVSTIARGIGLSEKAAAILGAASSMGPMSVLSGGSTANESYLSLVKLNKELPPEQRLTDSQMLKWSTAEGTIAGSLEALTELISWKYVTSPILKRFRAEAGDAAADQAERSLRDITKKELFKSIAVNAGKEVLAEGASEWVNSLGQDLAKAIHSDSTLVNNFKKHGLLEGLVENTKFSLNQALENVIGVAGVGALSAGATLKSRRNARSAQDIVNDSQVNDDVIDAIVAGEDVEGAIRDVPPSAPTAPLTDIPGPAGVGPAMEEAQRRMGDTNIEPAPASVEQPQPQPPVEGVTGDVAGADAQVDDGVGRERLDGAQPAPTEDQAQGQAAPAGVVDAGQQGVEAGSIERPAQELAPTETPSTEAQQAPSSGSEKLAELISQRRGESASIADQTNTPYADIPDNVKRDARSQVDYFRGVQAAIDIMRRMGERYLWEWANTAAAKQIEKSYADWIGVLNSIPTENRAILNEYIDSLGGIKDVASIIREARAWGNEPIADHKPAEREPQAGLTPTSESQASAEGVVDAGQQGVEAGVSEGKSQQSIATVDNTAQDSRNTYKPMPLMTMQERRQYESQAEQRLQGNIDGLKWLDRVKKTHQELRKELYEATAPKEIRQIESELRDLENTLEELATGNKIPLPKIRLTVEQQARLDADNAARAEIPNRIKNKEPVNSNIVTEADKIELKNKGYIKEGDKYVYKPSQHTPSERIRNASTKTPANPAKPSKHKPSESDTKESYDDFKKRYTQNFNEMVKYADTVGRGVFAEKMAKMAEENPEWVAKIEAEIEEQAKNTPKPSVPATDRISAKWDALKRGEKVGVSSQDLDEITSRYQDDPDILRLASLPLSTKSYEAFLKPANPSEQPSESAAKPPESTTSNVESNTSVPTTTSSNDIEANPQSPSQRVKKAAKRSQNDGLKNKQNGDNGSIEGDVSNGSAADRTGSGEQGSPIGGQDIHVDAGAEKQAPREKGSSDVQQRDEVGDKPEEVQSGSNGDRGIREQVRGPRGRLGIGKQPVGSTERPAENESVSSPSKPGVPAVLPQSDSAGSDAGAQRTPRVEDNFRINSQEDITPTGDITKIRANIAAVKILKSLEAEKREATPSEKKALAQYTGWGGFKEIFNTARKYETSWKDRYGKFHDELKVILTEKEWEDARMSADTAHYTSVQVVKYIWDIARKLGFKGGKVVEPAVGTGNFFGLMPIDLMEKSNLRGIELDATTSAIARHLYPSSTIEHKGFEKARIAPNSVDLFIGNVPFHEIGPFDKNHPKLNLHNYFFAKSFDSVKPGGLVVFITSNSTMDNNVKQREYLNSKADLIAAIRLPNNAFKSNAGTEVTTDILVFRKPDGSKIDKKDWIASKAVPGKDVSVSEYFINNPDMALGEHTTAGKMYRANSYALVLPEGQAIEPLMQKAFDNIPSNVMGAVVTPQNAKSGGYSAEGERRGQIVERDGQLWEVDAKSGELVKPEWMNDDYQNRQTPAQRVAIAKDFIKVREAYYKLIEAEADGKTDKECDVLRSKLNEAYDGYVKNNGTINNDSVLSQKARFMENDPTYAPITALEDFKEEYSKKKDKIVKIYHKGKIFKERVNNPRSIPEKAGNINDAIGISLNWFGKIDVGAIAKLLGVDENQAKNSLLETGKVFVNPTTGMLEHENQYLSGNVREKLNKAQDAAKQDQQYAANVKALIDVQPVPRPFNKIKTQITSVFQPKEVLEAFFKGIFKTDCRVVFHPLTGFSLVSKGRSNEITTEYAVQRVDGVAIANAALTGIKMHFSEDVPSPDGKGTVKVVDSEKNAAVEDMRQRIMREYQSWINEYNGNITVDGEETTVQDAIEKAYNDAYNGFVPANPSGSHLSFPGLTDAIKLYAHQAAGVARAITDGFAMFAHGVGSGKTLTQIVSAMELKRLGMVNKPLIVVHKATLTAFAREAIRAYPGKRILVATEKSFEKSNRQRFYATMANNNWDIIIMGHSQFNLLKPDPNSFQEYVREKISEIDDAIAEVSATSEGGRKTSRRRKGDDSNPTIRQLNALKRSLQAKLDSMSSGLDRRQDESMKFEDLGVDCLFIDEAHEYKNVPIITRARRIKGIPNGASQRAIDLECKIRFLHGKNGGKYVFLATGTPVVNTMAETYVMLKMCAPKVLEAFKIHTFDTFRSAFATTVEQVEKTWGGSYKSTERLSKFINLPQLVTMIRGGFDVRLGNDKLGIDVPKMEGGGTKLQIVESSKSFEKIVDWIERIAVFWENLSGKQKRESTHIPITTMQAGMAGAVDPRLIDPTMPDDPDSKVNSAIKNIISEYKDGTADKTTQLVICDRFKPMKRDILESSVPFNQNYNKNDDGSTIIDLEKEDGDEDFEKLAEKADNAETEEFQAAGFNLYHDIKEKLVKSGIPAEEVAIIHEYKDDKAKQKLFDMVNAGQVRIIIGSTQKLGVGVNIQQRLAALHEIDPPRSMTPAMREQRIGRIIRQGNLHSPKFWNKPVKVIEYGVKGSMDAAIYQMMATKQGWINQILMGDVENLDEIDDPASEALLDMKQMTALLADNPAALRKAEVDKELAELKVRFSGFNKNMNDVRKNLKAAKNDKQWNIDKSAWYQKRIDRIAQEDATHKDTLDVSIDRKKVKGDRDKVVKHLNELLTSTEEKQKKELEDDKNKNNSTEYFEITLNGIEGMLYVTTIRGLSGITTSTTLYFNDEERNADGSRKTLMSYKIGGSANNAIKARTNLVDDVKKEISQLTSSNESLDSKIEALIKKLNEKFADEAKIPELENEQRRLNLELLNATRRRIARGNNVNAPPAINQQTPTIHVPRYIKMYNPDVKDWDTAWKDGKIISDTISIIEEEYGENPERDEKTLNAYNDETDADFDGFDLGERKSAYAYDALVVLKNRRNQLRAEQHPLMFRDGDTAPSGDKSIALYKLARILGGSKVTPEHVKLVKRLLYKGLEKAGAYQDAMIWMSTGKGNVEETGLHEAVHFIEDVILSPEELAKWKAIEPNAEKRAEGLVDYARNKKVFSRELGFRDKMTLRAIYDRIIDTIKRLFVGGGLTEMEKVYEDILAGKYAGRPIRGKSEVKVETEKPADTSTASTPAPATVQSAKASDSMGSDVVDIIHPVEHATGPEIDKHRFGNNLTQSDDERISKAVRDEHAKNLDYEVRKKAQRMAEVEQFFEENTDDEAYAKAVSLHTPIEVGGKKSDIRTDVLQTLVDRHGRDPKWFDRALEMLKLIDVVYAAAGRIVQSARHWQPLLDNPAGAAHVYKKAYDQAVEEGRTGKSTIEKIEAGLIDTIKWAEEIVNRKVARHMPAILAAMKGQENAVDAFKGLNSDADFSGAAKVGAQFRGGEMDEKIDAASNYGVTLLAEGKKAAEWKKAMIEKYGEGVKPFIGRIKQASLKKLGDTVGVHVDGNLESTEAVRKRLLTWLQKQGVKTWHPDSKRGIAKVLEMHENGWLTDKDFEAAFENRYPIKPLTAERMQEIEKLSQAIKEAEDGFEKQDAIVDMWAYIHKNTGGIKKADLIESLFYNNILMGFPTHVRNILGTVFNMAADIALLAAVNPTISHKIIASALGGIGSGWTEAKEQFLTGRSMVKNVKLQEHGDVSEIHQFEGPFKLLNLWKYVGRLLRSEDILPFKMAQEAKAYVVAYRMALVQAEKDGRQKDSKYIDDLTQKNLKLDKESLETFKAKAEERAKAKNLSSDARKRYIRRRVYELIEQNRDPSMMDAASTFGGHATYNYTPEGHIGMFTEGLAQALNREIRVGDKSYKVFRPIKLGLIPFTRIVGNLVDVGLDYTPTGAVRAYKGTRIPGTGGEVREMDSDERNMRYAKAVLGTAGIISLLSWGGGDPDDDEDGFSIHGLGPKGEKRKQLMERGWKPYSVKLGSTYWSFINTPIWIPLTLVGQYHDAIRYKKDAGSDFGKLAYFAGMGTVSALLDQSILSGVMGFTRMVSTSSNNGEAAGRWLSRLGSSFLPGVPLLRSIDKMGSWLLNASNVTDADTVMEYAMSAIPFVQHAVKPALNAFGEPVVQAQGIWTSKTADKAWKALAKAQVFVSRMERPNDPASPVDNPKPVDSDTYYKLQESRGKELKRLILDNIDSIEDGTPLEARAIIKELDERAKQKALGEIGIGKPKVHLPKASDILRAAKH